MKYEVEKKYLVLPTSPWASMKSVRLSTANGECIFDVSIRLDYESPQRDVCLDMERFMGMSLELTVSPEAHIEIKQKDRKPIERFRQPLRPHYHFTSPEGWINDPNGMVYSEGLYHLFYQLNPCDTSWGNMHWGHATSKNLVDWEHLPIALFPDKTGAMFSGSGIADVNNLSGLKTGERTPILLFYTAAGSCSKASDGAKFTQCVAVSTDGGEAFVKSLANPVIDHIEGENRDPKVVYSDSLGLYVMSLYLGEDRYLILTSENLTQWKRVCEKSIPGDNECPAFFPMKNAKGEEKWILMGARDRYLVGTFDGNGFTPEREAPYVFNYTPERNVYAAQKFENTGERNIRMAWLKTKFAPYGMPFNGAMSFPQEMELVSVDGSDRIAVKPAREIEKLHSKKIKISYDGKEYAEPLKGIAQDIILTIDSGRATKAEISLFGKTFAADFANGALTSGEYAFPIQKGSDGRFGIRLLTDTCGIEIYTSDGKAYGVLTDIPDANLCVLKVSADEDIKIRGEAFRMRKARFFDKRK